MWVAQKAFLRFEVRDVKLYWKRAFIVFIACRHLIPRREHLTLLGCHNISDPVHSQSLACEIYKVRRLNGDIGGLDFPPEGESY